LAIQVGIRWSREEKTTLAKQKELGWSRNPLNKKREKGKKKALDGKDSKINALPDWQPDRDFGRNMKPYKRAGTKSFSGRKEDERKHPRCHQREFEKIIQA